MNILISNKIRIEQSTPALRRWIQKEYTIDNPEYIKLIRLGKKAWGVPRTLKLYEQYDDTIILPYGCLQALYMFLINTTDLTTVDIKTQLNRDKTAEWEGNTIIPRDYQAVAVNQMVLAKFGILKAPCSSGKTIMGHLIAQKTGMRTLWLTHTVALLNQSKAVGEMILGKGDRVGTITDGKCNPGRTITYATVQTMSMLDPKQYKDQYNCVICDEVHRVSKTAETYTQFSYVLNNVAAEYKYGLSATPETHNGYGKSIFCNVGDIKHTIPQSVLEKNGTIMPVEIHPIQTEWTYPKEAFKANGVLDFDKAMPYLRSDENRNALVAYLCASVPTLVLSNNIDHLCHMANALSLDQQKRACLVSTKHDDSILTADILCKHGSKANAEYIEKMRTGELDIMFATYQLAKEGLNIPRLEQVILAFPAVDENIITQSVGRVARCADGKNKAICYDLVDKPTYFQKHYRDRKRLYKKNGNSIVE